MELEMEKEDIHGVDLKRTYAFYYRLNEELTKDMKANEFANQVKLLSSFSNLKEFWSIFQHIRKPDTCKYGTELFMFADDIKPFWEDKTNKNGGKTTVRLRKNYSTIIWEELIFALLGEIIPSNVLSEITGIVMSIKKECNILQIWFKDYNQDKAILVEKIIRELLMVPDNVELETKQFFKPYVPLNTTLAKKEKDYKEEPTYQDTQVKASSIEKKPVYYVETITNTQEKPVYYVETIRKAEPEIKVEPVKDIIEVKEIIEKEEIKSPIKQEETPIIENTYVDYYKSNTKEENSKFYRNSYNETNDYYNNYKSKGRGYTNDYYYSYKGGNYNNYNYNYNNDYSDENYAYQDYSNSKYRKERKYK